MEYRRVGRAGLKVSALSIGGELTQELKRGDQSALRLIEAAIERGVNYLDLADIYGGGEAERACGELIKRLPRSKLILSSKCYWSMSDGVNDRGLSRKHIIESVERALKRFGVDYLDLFFCHRFDPDTPLEETARAMEDLIRQGKLLYWGTSGWSASQLYEVCALTPRLGGYAPIAEQPMYSVLEHGIEYELMPTARSVGVGLITWSPLAGGVLSGSFRRNSDRELLSDGQRRWVAPWLDEESSETVERLIRLSADLGCTPSQLALAWALRRQEVASVMMGVSTEAQLDENLQALTLTVEEEAWAQLFA
jgi:aryl-alcohol dehydrogenase-like predicted oxidoreductase